MPGYLFRRIGTALAPWNTGRQGGTPPDSGAAVQDPAPPAALPSRQSTPLRACAAAFVLLLSPTPPDAGTAPIPAAQPDRAPAAVRAASHAYAIAAGTPRDAGVVTDPPVAASVPSSAPAPRRAAPPPLLLSAPPIVAPWPPSDTFADVAGTHLEAHDSSSGGRFAKHPAYATGDYVVTAAGRIRSAAVNQNALYLHPAIPPTADYEVACDVAFVSDVNDAAGPAGRVDPVADTWYNVRYRNVPGTTHAFQLWKSVAGSATQLGSDYARTLAPGETARLVLRMTGSAVSLLVDGVTQVSATDSSVTAAGFAGVFGYSSAGDLDATGTHLDNFNAGGTSPPPSLAPSRPGLAASRPAAYAWPLGGVPLDVVAATAAAVAPQVPDRAAGPRRAAPDAYQVPRAIPPDAGDPSTSPDLPDRAPGPLRAASHAYHVATGTPRDAGDAGCPAEAPDLARGPMRASAPAYALIVPAPRDSGVAAVAPPVGPETPDLARGPLRAATSTYVALVSASPRDAGDTPIAGQSPDRAAGPRRSAASAYLVATGTPPDAGDTPVPASAPQRADRARPAGNAAYKILAGTPPDQGALPGPIAALYPDAASGPRRSAASAYLVATGTPPAVTVIIFPDYPDPFGAASSVVTGDPDPLGATATITTADPDPLGSTSALAGS